MTKISFAYAYSILIFYVLSSQNVQKFDFDLQVLYFTTTNEGVGGKKIFMFDFMWRAIASGKRCIKSWML
jgi:hypothetical protein